jgi:hypothetical protein
VKNNKNMQITVIVHPNSKNPRIEKDMFHTLHVYVTAPPLEGKANKAVIDSLAKYFGTKKSNVFMLRGGKSKNKVFEVGSF